MLQRFVLVDGQLLLLFRILELPWLLASSPPFSRLSGWIIFCQDTFLRALHDFADRVFTHSAFLVPYVCFG